jgi:transcriptional regulator with XRE-family HTH domain
MTVKQLAAALGIASHGYISSVETGRKIPSTEMIIKLADLFEVSIDALLRDELELPPPADEA